jgi:hypothetical protein
MQQLLSSSHFILMDEPFSEPAYPAGGGGCWFEPERLVLSAQAEGLGNLVRIVRRP